MVHYHSTVIHGDDATAITTAQWQLIDTQKLNHLNYWLNVVSVWQVDHYVQE